MRTAFIETLCELAEQNPNIWLLTGDLGFSVLERFAQRFPDRYLNVGVAEQNMTGIAAGLALSGKTVITYSIANFPTLRCLEQIRNDVCYHRANVKVVAVGGGMSYGPQGYTHYGLEDLGVMRVLPFMTVLAPGDPVETRWATQAMLDLPGPCYLRLGKAGEPRVHAGQPQMELGVPVVLRRGEDVTLVSTGGMLQNIVRAADLLEAAGVSTGVVSLPTVHPLDASVVCPPLSTAPLLGVVEEHGAVGGLFDALARLFLGNSELRLVGFHLNTEELLLRKQIGSQAWLQQQHGLSAEQIAASMLRELQRSQPGHRGRDTAGHGRATVCQAADAD